jgi:hypothetical protein
MQALFHGDLFTATHWSPLGTGDCEKVVCVVLHLKFEFELKSKRQFSTHVSNFFHSAIFFYNKIVLHTSWLNILRSTSYISPTFFTYRHMSQIGSCCPKVAEQVLLPALTSMIRLYHGRNHSAQRLQTRNLSNR